MRNKIEALLLTVRVFLYDHGLKIFLLALIIFSDFWPQLFDFTFDLKTTVYDFNVRYSSGMSELSGVLYHTKMVFQTAVAFFWIFKISHGAWRWIALLTCEVLGKECIDIILYNNQTATFLYEFVAYFTIIALIIIWYRLTTR